MASDEVDSEPYRGDMTMTLFAGSREYCQQVARGSTSDEEGSESERRILRRRSPHEPRQRCELERVHFRGARVPRGRPGGCHRALVSPTAPPPFRQRGPLLQEIIRDGCDLEILGVTRSQLWEGALGEPRTGDATEPSSRIL